jgi:hypothetical protein
MKLDLIRTIEILDYEKEINVDLVIKERKVTLAHKSPLPRYFAYFENSSISIYSGGGLLSTFGDGNTIDEAIRDYCSKITNHTLVINGLTKDRTEHQVPKLIHTRLINI